jgi:hypothetical protein
MGRKKKAAPRMHRVECPRCDYAVEIPGYYEIENLHAALERRDMVLTPYGYVCKVCRALDLLEDKVTWQDIDEAALAAWQAEADAEDHAVAERYVEDES